MSLLQKLDQITARYAELQATLSGGSLDSQEFVAASKEYSDLGPLVEAIGEWRKAEHELKDAEAMAADPDMKTMAEEEAAALKKRLPELERIVKRMLLPKDAADEKNAILEIRAGTGGDEAALFAADLFRMYQRYAAEHGWRFEIMELSDTGSGLGGDRHGLEDAARLKFGSGVHRVQRRPSRTTLGGDRGGAAGAEFDIHRRKDLRTFCARGRAASQSTRPIRLCASPISRPASSSASRTRRASTRPGPRR
jgi:peptide chain release factor 1